ncbi:hypothetical protein Pmani_038736 [Petrolisthes manimaculis]|uniref:WD repeat-containing protein 18 n=1 Tax=Petrolisthes manimaculis TaxID=1843537 RepID=A0AAE1NF20_9EUCA|nr:hypothetical protein Pmani_038736 [Petrolisthes manimaculis]
MHFKVMEPMIDGVFVTSLNSGTDCIQVYDVATGAQLKSYRGHPAAPSTFSLVGTSSQLVCGQRNKSLLQAWNINRHDTLPMRLVVPGKVNALAVSPKPPYYCVVAINEKIYVYKMSCGGVTGVGDRHYQSVTHLVFTPCGNYFASGGTDGFVYVWSLAAFNDALHKTHPPHIQPHYTLGQHSDKVTGLTITSGGMRGTIASCSLDHTARIYDLATGRQVYNIITPSPLTAITTNTLGSQVLLGSCNGRVNVVNLLPPPTPGDVLVSEEGSSCHEKAVTHIAVTASGNRVLTGSDDGEVKVWTVTSTSLGTNTINDTIITPHLAIQRTIHTARGTITNMCVLRMEREVVDDMDLDIREIIRPLSQDHTSSPLNASVTIHTKPRTSSSVLNITSQYTNVGGLGKQNTKGARNTNQDLLSQICQLQNANSQLYKFAIKHILKDELND